MRKRINTGYPEQMVDQAASTRTTRGDTYIHSTDEIDYLAHGKEISGKPQGGDRVEFGL